MKKLLVIAGTIIYIFVFCIVSINYFKANKYVDYIVPKQVVAEYGKDTVISIPVKILNKTLETLDSEEEFYLSYHLLDEFGNVVKFDNRRTEIRNATPGVYTEIELAVEYPELRGKYILEVDIVKEGSFWYGQKSNTPSRIQLVVK